MDLCQQFDHFDHSTGDVPLSDLELSLHAPEMGLIERQNNKGQVWRDLPRLLAKESHYDHLLACRFHQKGHSSSRHDIHAATNLAPTDLRVCHFASAYHHRKHHTNKRD